MEKKGKHVLYNTKEPGGIMPATILTWMAITTAVRINQPPMALIGISGLGIITRWDLLRWKYDKSAIKDHSDFDDLLWVILTS